MISAVFHKNQKKFHFFALFVCNKLSAGQFERQFCLLPALFLATYLTPMRPLLGCLQPSLPHFIPSSHRSNGRSAL